MVIPGGWVCVYSGTLWVFPTKSPVKLECLPLLPQPPQGFSVRGFEALFPCPGTLGCVVYLDPQLFLLVYLHANVRLPCPPAAASSGLPATTLSASVLQPLPCRKSSPSGCPSPPLLLLWMNVSSLSPWLLDFHTVQFSVSSGCFLFLNLFSSFFWLCEEAQCVYLCLYLGRSYLFIFREKGKKG